LGHVGLHVYSQGKVSVAQSIFEQLHVFAPEEPRVANSLGFILTGGGRLSDARELFLHALTRADKPIMRPVILANLGYLYLVEGHLTEAIESLQESASLAAADNKAILRVAYWEDGSVLPDPVPYPTRWLPIWTAVKANQVTLALAQDLVEVAQALAQQIIDEAPDGSWGYAMLGWVLRTKVDFDGARQAWQQALAHTEDQQDRDAIARWLESLPE
jgi:Flp pilus assembly protein TadD